ncbi:MAG TPA: hypothetical protein VI365_17285 [Trebonia sp.]
MPVLLSLAPCELRPPAEASDCPAQFPPGWLADPARTELIVLKTGPAHGQADN